MNGNSILRGRPGREEVGLFWKGRGNGKTVYPRREEVTRSRAGGLINIFRDESDFQRTVHILESVVKYSMNPLIHLPEDQET